MSRCPLYQQVLEVKPWQNTRNANIGLLFDKFVYTWNDSKWEIDKKAKKAWLQHVTQSKSGDRERLKEAYLRQHRLTDARGGSILRFTNESRFVTGLGRTHPIENGFAFHPTLGTPYLPGSGVKGVLAAWLRETTEDWDWNRHEWDRHTNAARWFGTQEGAGSVIFLDLLPTAPPKMVTEIMTPHYGPYYQDETGRTPPADWHSPTPISFLSVEEGQQWQVAILPAARPDGHKSGEPDLEAVADALADALDWLGAGAKTAIGHGRFARHEEAEKSAQDALRDIREQDRAEREKEERLAQLHPDVAELERRFEDKNRDNRDHFLNIAEQYLLDHPSPAQPAVGWLREKLVAFWPASGSHPDIWTAPDAVKGKKDKPVHSSKRARQIVHSLKKPPQ